MSSYYVRSGSDRRGKFETRGDILGVIVVCQPIKKTAIMQKANLNMTPLTKELGILVKLKMVKREGSEYFAEPEGVRVFRKIEEAREALGFPDHRC